MRGVWGIKNDVMSSTYAQGWAGGNDTALNSRDRYIKANSTKATPFGTSQVDSAQNWNSTTNNNFRPVTAQQVQSTRIAGAPSRQQIYVQQQYSAKSSTCGTDEEILEKFRDRMRQRGARGILNLKRVFKIIDDNNNGLIDYQEFMKAIKDYRIQVTPEEAHFLFGIFDINQDGSISYDEFLRQVVGTMSTERQQLVKRAF